MPKFEVRVIYTVEFSANVIVEAKDADAAERYIREVWHTGSLYDKTGIPQGEWLYEEYWFTDAEEINETPEETSS